MDGSRGCSIAITDKLRVSPAPIFSNKVTDMKRLLILALALAAPAFADTLYVTEFAAAYNGYQAVKPPATASQAIAITASSTQTAAFNVNTGIVRVHADVACLIEVGGTNPTAASTSMRLAAGQTEYFITVAGDKIAVKTP